MVSLQYVSSAVDMLGSDSITGKGGLDGVCGQKVSLFSSEKSSVTCIGTRMPTKHGYDELPDVKPREWEPVFSNLTCQCEK